MKVSRLTGTALICAVLFSALAARAGQTTVGVSINGTIGSTEQSTSRTGHTVSTPFLPLPSFTVERRVGRASIFLEGIPPIGPVQYDRFSQSLGDGGNFTNYEQTRLSVLFGVLRFALRDGTRIGIGETILNQRSSTLQGAFAPASSVMFPDGSRFTFPQLTQQQIETQQSHVVGARYELSRRLIGRPRWSLDASFAASPHLTAIITDELRHAVTIGTRTRMFVRRPEFAAEQGSLIDTALSVTRIVRRNLRFSYGLRYVNYVARFADSGSLADRESFVMPFVGWSAAIATSGK